MDNNFEQEDLQDIKKQLKLKGYKFFSSTDTEVVLNSIIEWGEEAIKKFNGMFAFAFWDDFKKELEGIQSFEKYPDATSITIWTNERREWR